ncbi:hypothetical protein M441DRAFT_126832 [Trichoderma asperellum CBS 433.97]|uniref:Uncharacterized protein n=1 Tax=Trichoderma asperellum (strain ATCC 204424 / CBS 433.97 / NBRC 101777) TaxID=1042311 RepID=A0A2T3ZN75_TRIA4|nr:hypothetical protein M441DRAFT_126832 [Trichoderma asperellum CBS 433.97]PTB46247.1 hypothetical protein M441DRAFT_126832 [Trichoderma asperellum CBS 433.97]
MDNEEAFPTIPADNTGSSLPDEFASETRPVRFSDAAAASFGSSDELQKESPREQSLDAEFSTQGEYVGICPDCLYPLLLDNATQQHSDYCHNMFVQNLRAEPSSFNDREERNFLLQDPSLSTATAVPSATNTSTAILPDVYENTTGGSHDTDEPSLGFSSIQPPQLPHVTNNQPQPIMESGRHSSDNATSSDEQSYARHRREAHEPGNYPCPHPQCKKFKIPFKRADKLQNHHRNTCKIERQLRGTTSPS